MQSSPRTAGEALAPFPNRPAAGRALARMLAPYACRSDTLVLALPRGGVPVGFEVARALGASLDVLTVRKLGFPGRPELAMGAIASGGVCVLNEELVREHGISGETVAKVAEREAREIVRQEGSYRGHERSSDPRDRTVILVDDGLATGATMRAAVLAVRAQHPASIVVAIPVGAEESLQEMKAIADAVVCPLVPPTFRAVGLWYSNFEQVTDAEVRSLLELARTAS